MDAKSFNSIIIPHYRQMYAVAMRILRNSADAADAVQDTMTKLWAMHNKLDDIDTPASFCIRAIRNHCIDRLRASRPTLDIDEAAAETAPTASDDRANAKSSETMLRRVIATMQPNQQQVMMLSAFSDLSNDEIASATGLTEANVRQLLSRGRRTLKEKLLKLNES